MPRITIDAPTSAFDAETFTSERRAGLRKAFAPRTPVEAAAAPPSPTKVLDLFAALELSVKAPKAANVERAARPKPIRRHA